MIAYNKIVNDKKLLLLALALLFCLPPRTAEAQRTRVGLSAGAAIPGSSWLNDHAATGYAFGLRPDNQATSNAFSRVSAAFTRQTFTR